MEPEDELLNNTTEEDNLPGEEATLGDAPQIEVDRPPHDVEDHQPVAPDPSMLDDQTLLNELQRRQQRFTQPDPYANDPRLAQIVELSHTNPAMAEALRLQIAEERATARVMDHIAPIADREALQNSGLSNEGQQYLRQTLSQIPGASIAQLMNDSSARDVLIRAAKQYEAERAPRSTPRYESAASEAPTLSNEDWRAIREFERMTGDRLDTEVIRSAKRGL